MGLSVYKKQSEVRKSDMWELTVTRITHIFEDYWDYFFTILQSPMDVSLATLSYPQYIMHVKYKRKKEKLHEENHRMHKTLKQSLFRDVLHFLWIISVQKWKSTDVVPQNRHKALLHWMCNYQPVNRRCLDWRVLPQLCPRL